jgi:hypothetical protein
MNNLTLGIADNIVEFIEAGNFDRKEVEKFADHIIKEVREWDKEAWGRRNER